MATQFAGTLHFVMNGMTKQSVMVQQDALGNISGALLIRNLPAPATLMQQVAAATGFFANNNEGDHISVNGDLVQLGINNIAIRF